MNEIQGILKWEAFLMITSLIEENFKLDYSEDIQLILKLILCY